MKIIPRAFQKTDAMTLPVDGNVFAFLRANAAPILRTAFSCPNF